MVRIIKWKKFSHLRSFIAMCVVTAASNALANNSSSSDLPHIRNVGVVPVQHAALDAARDLNQARNLASEVFGGAVRASKRFVVLDDDFIASKWSSADGRQELAEDHELHAFISLEIQLREDTVIWYSRLLSPALDTYLIESESMSRTEFAGADKGQVEDRLQTLVFRMLNRLPLDTSVTSVQGKYVTLSGGAEQGINNQDEFTIEQASVVTTHPATGAWLKFDRRVIGKVKIIEVKQLSAIAEIVQMTADDSIKIGHGAKIPDLASRLRFRRVKAESPTAATDAKPIPSTPLYDVEPQRPTMIRKEGDSTPIGEQPSGAEAPEDAPDGEGSGPDVMAALDSLIDYGSIDLGLRYWTVTGAAKAEAGSLPLHFFAHAGRNLSDTTALEAGANVGFGSTLSGGFSGFGIHGRLVYRGDIAGGMHWFASGGGGLSSLAVSDEPVGGYDFTFASGSGGIGGTQAIAEQRLNWKAELELRPFHIGRVGIRGSFADIKSSLATVIRLAAYQEIGPKNLEWGGAFESASGSFSLAKNMDVTYSDVTLIASGRMRF
jgi:hypothetical protein